MNGSSRFVFICVYSGSKSSLFEGGQLVDISKLGLNSKIKKFSYSFICGKGYFFPLRGRIAFCLQSDEHKMPVFLL